MALTLDFVSKRYGKLPSEMLEVGSSIDVHIAEIAVEYENYLYKKERGDISVNVPKMSQEQMQAMIDRVKNENKS